MTPTSSATATAAKGVSTLTVLRRAAAAEWTRLWSLRSTWWALLAAAALMLFMGAAAGYDFAGDPTPIWWAAEFAIVPGQFGFLLVVMLSVTAEYSTGAIRSSLQWVPRRGILLVARTVVPVAVATAAAVPLALATDLVAWAWMGDDAQVVVADIALSLAMIALFVATGGLLTVGLANVLRSTAGALTSIFLLQLALPMMLPAFEVAWLTSIAEHLPGFAGASLLDAMEIQLDADTVAVVLVSWTTAATTAGAWSLLRRDAA